VPYHECFVCVHDVVVVVQAAFDDTEAAYDNLLEIL